MVVNERSSGNNLINIPIRNSIPLRNHTRFLPNVLVVNARSILGKVDELEYYANEHKIEIIIVTETWLSDNIPSEVVSISRFILIRKDRKSGLGGGCAIYVREEIPVKTRCDLFDQNFECQWLILRPKWLPRTVSRIAVASVYLPPSMDRESLDHFYDYFYSCHDIVSSESPETGFIVAGDFNPCSNGFDPKCISKYCDVNLKQVVKDPTRNSNILDLIFTNIGSDYNCPEVIAPLSTSDHNMIIWKAKVQQGVINIVNKIKFRPIRNHKMQQFASSLFQYDWSTLLNTEDVDEKVDIFTRATSDMINYYFPEKTARIHSDDKFFITAKIKRLLKKRDNAYKQGGSSKFKELRNRVALEIRRAKKNYYKKNIGGQNSKGDARTWWKKVWKLTGKKRTPINLSEPGSGIILEDEDTANRINTFFANLTMDFPAIQSKWLSYGQCDVLPTITPESVAKKLSSIQVNKAPGPNDPCLRIIKMFAHFFAIPLANIFNASFGQKVFPKLWKEFYLAPIPKIEPCTELDEIRPIALTSTISKIQESYAVDWMYNDIETSICKEQYGGVPRSSAVLALVYLVHKWTQALELPQRVIRIVFLDFRKAFDIIDHNVLLDNCCKIGVRPGLIGWLGSYLSSRTQVTRFGNKLSTCCTINGGVPQGSRIGPLAFIVHINGLQTVINDDLNTGANDNSNDEDLTLFMDDTTLSEVINVSDHVSGLQVGSTPDNVRKIMNFASSQKMELNLKKCKEMQLDFRKNMTVIPALTFNDTTLERVSSFKLLGLWIDDNVKWETNTEYIIGKAVKRLFLLKVLKKYGADINDMKRFYISAIRPTLEYGAQVWHGGLTEAQSSSIEKVQERVLKIIYSEKNYEKTLLKAGLQTLQERRIAMCIDLVDKMSSPQHKLHHLLPNKRCQIRQRDTRQNGELYYNYQCRTERFRKSPIVSSIELYNNSLNI